MGNAEDNQIGTLLIEAGARKETMDKLERAVVPQLEILKPRLASTFFLLLTRHRFSPESWKKAVWRDN